MPYIKEVDRWEIGEAAVGAVNVGELNYVITSIIWDYLKKAGISYSALNSVIGVLECAKLELYRRIAAPYENSKIAENGDVYL